MAPDGTPRKCIFSECPQESEEIGLMLSALKEVKVLGIFEKWGSVNPQAPKSEADHYRFAKAKYIPLFLGVSCLLAKDRACVFVFT